MLFEQRTTWVGYGRDQDNPGYSSAHFYSAIWATKYLLCSLPSRGEFRGVLPSQGSKLSEETDAAQ